MKPSDNLARIQIILVETQDGANIGSVCRAMKTMGLSRLVLVTDKTYDEDRVRTLALHASDLWENAVRYATLEEALKRKWISVGCHMYRGKGAAFDPDGNILPCTHFSEAPLFTNTIMENGTFSLKEKFLEMWSDQAGIASKFRSGLWKYPAKKCAECKYWGGCIGGCPLLWTYFDPLIFIDEK